MPEAVAASLDSVRRGLSDPACGRPADVAVEGVVDLAEVMQLEQEPRSRRAFALR